MSRWDGQLAKHGIHETIRQLEAWVDTEFEDQTAEALVEARRITKVLEAYKGHLKNLDPELTPFNQIDSLNSALRQQAIWAQLHAYSTNGNPSHLVNANNNLDNQLTQLALVISIAKKSRTEKPLKAVERAVDKHLEKLTKLETSYSVKLKSFDTKLSEQTQQLSTLEKQVAAQLEEASTLTSSWQEQFSNAQEKRSTDFGELRDKLIDESHETLKQIQAKANKSINSHTEEFVSYINNITEDADEKHNRILELYELAAGDSVAGAYEKNANEEKSTANNWRLISLIFIFLTVIWLLAVYALNSNANPSNAVHWPKLLTTLSLTGVLLYGAAYAAQQSTKHRNNEKQNRRFALEVKAIDPFIASLAEEDKSALKKMLSERLFGHSANDQAKDTKVIDEHAFGAILKPMTDFVTQVRK